MSEKIQKLQANIPVDNKWSLEDVDKRAEELGLNRTQLILKAVDMMMNFDNDFIEYIKFYAEGLQIPEYLVIQNQVLKVQADREARAEVYGRHNQMLSEFRFVTDEKGTPRTITGAELKEQLKTERVGYYKREKYRKEETARRNQIEQYPITKEELEN